MDFNNDRKADLAVVDYPAGISLLMGNGDGTFQSPSDNNSFTEPFELAVGDFDNDHKLDVVVTSVLSDFGILLGNGDRSLQTASTYPLTYYPGAVSTAEAGGGNISCARLPQGVSAQTGDGDATLMVVGPASAVVNKGAGRIDVGGAKGSFVGSTDSGELHIRAVPTETGS